MLVLKRSLKYDYDAGRWETVSGRLEQYITDVKSELLREIREEVGSDLQCEVIAPFGKYNFYRGENNTQEHVGIDYICKYASGDIQLNEEHTEYRWIGPKDFESLNASQSLKDKVWLSVQVHDWFLKNSHLFKGFK